MNLRPFRQMLLMPYGAEGGAAGDTPPPKSDAGQGQGDPKGPDLAKQVEALIARHGGPDGAVRTLMSETYNLRDKNRELIAKIPPDGAVVLQGEDAKHWGSYQSLGKVADLRTALAERDTFRTEAGTLRKAETGRTVAEVMGWKPGVLATLAKDLDLEVRDEVDKDGKAVLKDGKPVRVAVVKGEGDKATLLKDYAAAHWGDFLSSLATTTTVERPRGTPSVGVNGGGLRPAPAGQGERQGPPARIRAGM